MNENIREPIQIKITQDKIVDLLLHAATREDIAKLAVDNENLRNDFKMDMYNLQTATREDIAKLANDNQVMRNDFKTAMLNIALPFPLK